MNHWFHCNQCFMMGAGGNGSFWFTSCGHLICLNCLKSSGAIPGQKGSCIVCRRQDSVAIEINRSMRPDILAMFRPPKDVFMDYASKLKTILDYQANQSQHLIKHLHEKSTRAVKFAKAAQSEIAKRSECEQSIMAENGQMKAELEKAKQYTQHLKNMLAERDQEIQHLKHKYHKSPRATICRATPSPHKNKIGSSIFPSLNGPTPVSKLSFYACTTSTPFEPKRLEAASTPPFLMRDMFNTPQAREESTMAAGGLDYFNQRVTNTPALLGIAPGYRNGPKIMKKNYF